MATFDQKFGADSVSQAPTSPGVYRFYSRDGVVLYVGKGEEFAPSAEQLSQCNAQTRASKDACAGA